MKTIGQIINDAIPHATRIILDNNGIAITHEANPAARYDAVAVIGFSGNGFGGALGFAAESVMIEAAYGESDTRLSDSWLGEVANQLLGRVKNALLGYGVEIRLAIPMVLHGLDLKVRDGDDPIKQFPCVSEHGGACVWIDANWNIHQLVHPADAAEQPQGEGELMLF